MEGRVRADEEGRNGPPKRGFCYGPATHTWKKKAATNRILLPRNRHGTRIRPKLRNKDILLGTWNVLSWYRPGIATHAIKQLQKYQMDVTAIQEMRWTGSGSLQMENSLVFWSGEEERHEFGCGFVVNGNLKSAIIDFKPINKRMCSLRLKGKWFNLTLFSIHAPTEEAAEDDKDEFYEILEQQYTTAPRYDVKIILGDFNAKLGKEDHLRAVIGTHSLHDNTNDNGSRLAEFAVANNMVVKTTQFQRKDIYKVTWVSNDGNTRNQIDHVLIDGRHSSNIINAHSLRGAESDSDHFLVRTKMRARLNTRHPKQRQQGKRWDITRLDLPDNERQYQSLVQNKLQTLEEEETSTPEFAVDHKWQNIVNAIESAAAETIGKERNNKKKNQWFDQECEQSLQQKAVKRLELLTRPTTENREDYNRVRAQTRRLLRRKKKQYLEARIQQLEEEHRTGQSRQFYRDLKTMKGNTTNSPRFIKDDTGQLLTDDEEISRQWRKYFKQLLNTETPTTTGQHRQYQLAEPEIVEPTLAEVKSAISSLKNYKAPGPDGIQAELLKKGGEKLHLEIYHLIREVWEREEIPKHWHESHIIPIHKKGDKQICRNYRGISLVNTTYKILSTILFRRLTPYAEEIIGDYQSGFRPGRSTIDQIFVLRQVLEKNWEFNRDVHQIFVDFKQAYDSVSREALWKTMVELGVPGKLVRLAQVSTENASARIRIGNTTSEEFHIDTGLRQGDPLAPLLFNFALEHAVRKAQPQLTNGFAAQGSKILLAFADDVDTIAQSTRSAKEVFTLFETGAKEIGLKVNEDKTKYMVVTKNPRPRVRQNVTINEYNFEVVKEFKYLGAIITSENKYENDVAARIIAGNRTYYSLMTILKSKILSRSAKIRVYKTIIRPTITYGSETWTLNQRETTKLLVLERKILRTIYGPCRDETTGEWRRRHNNELQTIYGDENIVRYIKANRIRWAGHVLRSNNERLLNTTFWERPDGRRSVGRPRKRWKDAVASDLRKMGVQQWEIAAQDRQQWREIVNAAKTHLEL